MNGEEYKMMCCLERTHWWFLGRQYLLKQNLESLSFDLIQRSRILDIGCGTGIMLKTLEFFGSSYGIELSNEAFHYLKKQNLKHLIRSDANQIIPFKDDTFGIVTCFDVLEHLDNDLGLLREMVRVCRPGGYIFLTVPAFRMFWSTNDVALHHKRRYTRREMLDNLSELHCKVLKLSYYNTLLSIPILIIRKFKSLFYSNGQAQSDFSMKFPMFLNQILTYLFKMEISCLRFIDFPVGVSICATLKKLSGNQPSLKTTR